jgi:hypothetical protein
MPSATSLKRSNSDTLESEPPCKIQKPTSFDSATFTKEYIQTAIAEFSQDQLRNLLVESALTHPPLATSIQKLFNSNKATKLAIPPLNFTQHAPNVQEWFDEDPEPRGKLRGSMLESIVADEIRDNIVECVQQEILAKVEKHMCYETKYNALTALVDIGWVVVNADYDERSDEAQSGEVPDALIEAMLQIAGMMSPDEVLKVVAEMDGMTRQFIAARAKEIEEESRKVKPVEEVVSDSWMLGYRKPDPDATVAAHDEVRGLDVEKSFVGKVLRLRWADNPNGSYRQSWKRLDDVVGFFMGSSNVAV